ncbi:MAG: VOC family protein [Chloroflexi bacterium]|nr:VOC family protein [Chloroflexota bacterium]
MQKITPHLWYDNQAEEAASFYTSIFKNSKVGSVSRYGDAGAKVSGRPKGSVMTLTFELEGQQFIALNGGPIFTFTPAVSFFVSCERPQEIDELWRRFTDGGRVLMELDKYAFAEKFGWLQDKYGLSWQLILASRTQKITPYLMFVREQHGKAEEAMKHYVSIFPDSNINRIERYGKGGQEPEGTVMHAVFSLAGQEFIAMDSALDHRFTFTEAISFLVNCETQEEMDYYWEELSEGGDATAQQCGWLKDKYGLSWQIVPAILAEMIQDPDAAKSERVMTALLPMKKIDIEVLRQAFEGR